MALNASQNWFLRPSGLETNGGGFDIGATAGMLTDLACDTNTGNTTSPVVSSASYNFVAGDVGHWVYIAAGTNWRPGFYQIVSVASNKATLSAAVGAAYVPYFSTPSVALGCASVATPTGGTFSINYSDSDSPLLSLTDLTSTASTTVTSSAALFTKAMIGNIIRLASATGSPVADSAGSRYLCITTYTNTSTVVMDKVSGTYTLGVAKMGGAHAQMKNYMTGGVGASPALTSPLAAGHQINVRGSGGNNPSSADYTAQDDYYTFPAGSVAAGQIFVVGYNGRPSYSSAKILTFHVVDGWTFKHLKFQITTTSISYTGYGVVGGNSSGGVAVRGPDFEDCYFDQFGADTACVSRSNGNNDCGSLINCLFDNTGSTTAGTYATASFTTSYGAKILGTIFRKQRGWALEI